MFRSAFCVFLAVTGSAAFLGSPIHAGFRETPLPPASAAVPPMEKPVDLGNGRASSLQLIAKLKNPTTTQRADALRQIQSRDLSVTKEFTRLRGLMILRKSPKPGSPSTYTAAGLKSKIRELEQTGLFEYVEPDWIVHAQTLPTDSRFTDGTLWGLRNTGQSGGTAGVDINAVAAWNTTTGSPNVVVAVIDSGVRYTHQDLAANMWVNPGEIAGNGFDDDSNGYVDDIHGINAITGSGNPMDDNDHGTHVAGTIAAAANSGGGHVGVAYGVRIMALKFLAADGSGSLSDAVECIEYATARGVKITNNSWGGGGFSQALFNAIQSANQAGSLFIAAAGNESNNSDSSPAYPASYNLPNVISVAAIDRNGALANFSNFGATSVDLAAPGVSIYSSTATSNTSYDSFNGTSMASPHVAGVAALLLSQFPSATVQELRSRLLNTTVALPSLAGKTVTGGRVNAQAALTVSGDGQLELQATASTDTLPLGTSTPVFVSVNDLYPVTNATVTGSFPSLSPVTFRDNGSSPDVAAGDGVYSANITTPASGSSALLTINASAPGKSPASASFSFLLAGPPANNNFTNRITVAPGTTSTTGNNRFATRETNEPLNPAVAGGKTVWWQWTAGSNGSVTFSTAGSSFDTTLAVYTGNAVNALTLVGSNDDSSGVQSAVTFPATSGTTYRIQVDGYAGATGDIVLNYPAPSGGAAGAPGIITEPADRTVLVGEPFELSVEAFGQAPLLYQWRFNGFDIPGATTSTYSVAVSSEANEGLYSVRVSNGIGSDDSREAFVSVEAVATRPENDLFAEATLLTGASGRVNGSTVLATAESGEPNHAGASTPVESIWYAWTAPLSGTFTLDTFGSNFNTTLAVYTGNSPAALSPVASNNDTSGLQSQVSFAVTAGQTYRIAIDGSGAATGAVTLNYSLQVAPGSIPNNAFASRTVITGLPATVAGSNIGATGETNEPTHGDGAAPTASVWWTWTATVAGTVVINTFGSDFDTTMAVYTGTTLSGLTRVAENDDFNGLQSRVSLDVLPGQVYAIAVDGYGTAQGSVQLSISPLAAANGLVANAGPNQILEDDGFGILGVTLDGSASTSPGQTITSWTWTWDQGSASGVNPEVGLTVGVTLITLTVTDDAGNTDTDTVVVRINHLGGFDDTLIFADYFDSATVGQGNWNNYNGWTRLTSGNNTALVDEILEFSGPDTDRYASLGFYTPTAGTTSTRMTHQAVWFGDQVEISFLTAFTSSTPGRQDDDFSFEIYNYDGLAIGGLDFIDNGTSMDVYSYTTGANSEYLTTLNYRQFYYLTLRVNLNENTFDLLVNDNLVAQDIDFSESGEILDLGFIDFAWYYTAGSAGNGYMDVDDVYLIGLGDFSNVAPIADAGPNAQVSDTDNNGTQAVTLDGSGSEDPDGTINTYSWTWTGGSTTGISPTATFPLGTTTVTLTVTDNQGAVDTDTLTVTVSAGNVAPTAEAGSTISVTDTGFIGTQSVTLNGSASSDSDGTIVSYIWTWSGGSTAGVSPSAAFPLGTTVVTLTVTDDDGATDTDTVSVTVSLDPESDADNDGAPDAWELANGFDPNTSDDVDLLDSDGDGETDIREIFQGTERSDASEQHGYRNTSTVSSPSGIRTRYRRSTTQTAVVAQPVWSRDLVNWYPVGTPAAGLTTTVSETVVSSGPGYEIVEITIRITAGPTDRLFFDQSFTPAPLE
jgi:subtilisin family serine protease